MNTEKIVRLTVELTDAEAWEFAQFLKRVGHSDYQSLAERYNRDAPYLMIHAGEKIRKALAVCGYAPR